RSSRNSAGHSSCRAAAPQRRGSMPELEMPAPVAHRSVIAQRLKANAAEPNFSPVCAVGASGGYSSGVNDMGKTAGFGNPAAKLALVAGGAVNAGAEPPSREWRSGVQTGSRRGLRTLGPVSDLERHLPSEWWRTLFNSLYLET